MTSHRRPTRLALTPPLFPTSLMSPSAPSAATLAASPFTSVHNPYVSAALQGNWHRVYRDLFSRPRAVDWAGVDAETVRQLGKAALSQLRPHSYLTWWLHRAFLAALAFCVIFGKGALGWHLWETRGLVEGLAAGVAVTWLLWLLRQRIRLFQFSGPAAVHHALTPLSRLPGLKAESKRLLGASLPAQGYAQEVRAQGRPLLRLDLAMMKAEHRRVRRERLTRPLFKMARRHSSAFRKSFRESIRGY